MGYTERTILVITKTMWKCVKYIATDPILTNSWTITL